MTTASEIDTILESLWDRTANTIQRVVLKTGESYTIPANLIGIRFQMIAAGGAGGVGGTTGGGGGGGAGQYVEAFLPAAALPAVGDDMTFDGSGIAGTIVATDGHDGAAAVTVTGGAGGNCGLNTSIVGTPGVGGAAGVVGGSPSARVTGGGGGGGSAGASGGSGGYSWTANDGGNSLEACSPGPGASSAGRQGFTGNGYGAGGGGGGGSSTGCGGGGAAGWLPFGEVDPGGNGGSASTAAVAGTDGICVLTIFRGGV